MHRWITNVAEVEIEITSYCNLACFNCNRSIRQAPTDECMSVSQIEKFVSESLALGWEWKQITLIGGEPTLHKQFWKILAVLERYKSAYPKCVIEVSTNGYGDRVRRVLAELPDWVQVDNSRKTSNEQNFDSYNIAPVDLPEMKNADFSRGCWITSQCGIGLTGNGYYPCGPGASVDRVFGFDIGLQQLSDIRPEALIHQLSVLCRNCGHFKANYGADSVQEEAISPTWKRAYAAYKENKPKLTKY